MMKINTRHIIIIALAINSSCLVLHFLTQLHPMKQSMVYGIPKEKEYWQKPDNNRTLTVRMIGGLGNQLWIYAAAYGLAKKTNRQPVACVGYDIHKVFSNLFTVEVHRDEDCLEGTEIKKRSVQLNDRPNHLSYDTRLPQVLNRPKPQHAFLCCYLQNLGYFVEYLDEIREQLIIQDALQTKAQLFLTDLLHHVAQNTDKPVSHNQRGEMLVGGKQPVLVTVHVRRSNMLAEKTVYQPGASYFKQAMGQFRKRYGASVVFVVATDDLAWSKKNIHGQDVYFTGDTGGKSREDEFAIAVACNHTVMSVGTFGWWMAFVTGGEVVYLQNWALGAWKSHYIPHQYFPHSWKGIIVNQSANQSSKGGV